MLTEVESEQEPTTVDRRERLLSASCDSRPIGAEGSGTLSSIKGLRIGGGNGSRASFSTKCQMSDGDCKSLFSCRV